MSKQSSLAPARASARVFSSLSKIALMLTAVSTDIKAYLALLVVYLTWGTTMGAMSLGVATIPPALLIFSRFALAAVLLLLFCRLRKEPLPSLTEIRQHCIAGTLLFFAGNAVTVWAVQYVPTVLGAILVATTPFWMIGLAAAQPPREPLKPQVLAGIGLGFSGIVVLLWPQLMAEIQAGPASSLHLSSNGWLGVLAILSTAFFWALGSLYKKQHPTQSSVWMGLGIQNLWAAICLLPFCAHYLGTKDLTLVHPNAVSIWSLAYLILMGTIVATPCYFYVLRTLPVSIASTFAYVTPILTMLFGWKVLGEPLTPTLLLGSLVIFGGVVLVQMAQSSPAESDATPSQAVTETMLAELPDSVA